MDTQVRQGSIRARYRVVYQQLPASLESRWSCVRLSVLSWILRFHVDICVDINQFTNAGGSASESIGR